MKIFLIGFIVIAFAVGCVYGMSRHDAAMEAAYQTYDNCVLAQYGVSAAVYYQREGHTAECN